MSDWFFDWYMERQMHDAFRRASKNRRAKSLTPLERWARQNADGVQELTPWQKEKA